MSGDWYALAMAELEIADKQGELIYSLLSLCKNLLSELAQYRNIEKEEETMKDLAEDYMTT